MQPVVCPEGNPESVYGPYTTLVHTGAINTGMPSRSMVFWTTSNGLSLLAVFAFLAEWEGSDRSRDALPQPENQMRAI